MRFKFRRETILWAFLLLGILPVFYYSCLKPWTWGTADEPTYVNCAREFHAAPTLRQKITALHFAWKPDGGRYQPLRDPYITGRLALSESTRLQHIFQFILILGIFLAWYRLAVLWDVESAAIPLSLLFALYLGPFTIGTMNFLSLQEPVGLLGLSWALVCATLAKKPHQSLWLIPTLTLTVLSWLLKETFFCLMPVVILVLWQKPRRAWDILLCAVLAAICVIFPWVVLNHVRETYTASYQISAHAILWGAGLGLKNLAWTYKFAMPFLVGGTLLRLWNRTLDRFDGFCVAGAALYFAMLIPWTSEMTYYHGPLAPFIGFLSARGALAFWDWPVPRARGILQSTVVLLCMLSALSIGRQARHVYLANDGLHQVRNYLIAHLDQEKVYVNGEEAARTIPLGMNLEPGVVRTYGDFIFARPNTSLTAPAYLLISTGQVRYLPPAIPSQAKKIFTVTGWEIYRMP